MKVKPPAKISRTYKQGARAQAAKATGQRVIDAFLSRLMQQWFDEITLDAVAEDAGVTVQTVIRKFGNKNGLLAQAVKTFANQVNARRSSPKGDIKTIIDNLFHDYEESGDAVIRLLALEERHQELKDTLNFGRNLHREWVANAFEDSFPSSDEGERRRMLDCLVITADVYTWKLLRRDMRRSIPASSNLEQAS